MIALLMIANMWSELIVYLRVHCQKLKDSVHATYKELKTDNMWSFHKFNSVKCLTIMNSWPSISSNWLDDL